jgi:hypothetical protein
MTTFTWADLHDELNRWGDAGRTATFWWRDDDAVEPTPALDRLLRLAQDHAAPLALAVIPVAAQPTPAAHLTGQTSPNNVCVQLHGYAHVNHAAAGEKKSEYPAGRAPEAVETEISQGLARLRTLFGPLAAPVFVPPWNRIAPATAARLPHLGLAGLSTFGPRRHARPAPGLVQANTHVDPVDWRGSRGYAGDDRTLAAAIAHLRRRRSGECDAEEPTGLLTHHLVHDDALWAFTARFAQTVARHPAAQWLNASEVFRNGANP